MAVIGRTSTIKTTFEKRYDADGKVWLQVIPHGDLVAKTPYWVTVNEFGYVSIAMTDVVPYAYVGVPEAAVDASEVDYCWLQIGGQLDGMVTPSLSVSVGHALNINGGAVVDSGVDFTGLAGQFAVCRTESTTATAQDVLLVPERFLSVT